jgi:hypothetical protein
MIMAATFMEHIGQFFQEVFLWRNFKAKIFLTLDVTHCNPC